MAISTHTCTNMKQDIPPHTIPRPVLVIPQRPTLIIPTLPTSCTDYDRYEEPMKEHVSPDVILTDRTLTYRPEEPYETHWTSHWEVTTPPMDTCHSLQPSTKLVGSVKASSEICNRHVVPQRRQWRYQPRYKSRYQSRYNLRPYPRNITTNRWSQMHQNQTKKMPMLGKK